MNQRISIGKAGRVFNLDLTEETPGIRKNLFNPENLTKKGYGYTYRFTLPYTPINMDFFGYYNEPQTRITERVGFVGIAYYYFDEVLVFIGAMTLQRATPDGYEVGIRSVGNGWIEAAQIPCNELPIANSVICCNEESGFYESNSDYIVPMCDYGQLVPSPNSQAGLFRLWAKVKQILDAAVATVGYQISSNFLNNNPMAVYSGINVLTSQNEKFKFGESQTNFFNSNGTTFIPNVLPPITYLDLFETVTFNPAELQPITAQNFLDFTGITCMDLGGVNFTLKYEIELDVAAVAPGGVIIIQWLGGSSVIGNVNVGVNTYVGELNIAAVSTVSLSVYVSQPSPTFIGNSYNVKFSLKTVNHYNFKVVPVENFPKYTVGFLLQQLSSMFNLFISSDESTNKIYIEPYETFILGGKELDWTRKVLTQLGRANVENSDLYAADVIDFEYKTSKNYLSKSWVDGVLPSFGPGVIAPTPTADVNFGNFTVNTSAAVNETQSVSVDFFSFFNYNYGGVTYIPYFGSNTTEGRYTGEEYISNIQFLSPASALTYDKPDGSTFINILPVLIWFDFQGFTISATLKPAPTTRQLAFGGEFGLYETYWKFYINQNINTRVFTYDIMLDMEDIYNLDFRNRVRIENRTYRILDIDQWTPDVKVAQVRLLEIL